MNKNKLWILLPLLFILILLLIIYRPKSALNQEETETPEVIDIDLTNGDIDFQFTNHAAGWKPINGERTWSVEDDFYQSTGIEGKYTSSKIEARYNEITYTIRLRRGGSDNQSQGIYFFGQAYPISSLGEWHDGYTFDITNNGYFIIGMYVDGEWTALSEWTPSPEITGWWNILKVTSNGSTSFTQFFINGKRVAHGTLTSFKGGLVGIGFYCESSSKLFIDYANVKTTAPESSEQSNDTGGILIDETSPIDIGDWSRAQSP